MKPEKTLGRELKSVVNLIERKMVGELSTNGAEYVTPMHGMILGYLHHAQEREIYQRDIEAEFHITRSTVTSLLQLMEKKGYIRREGVSHDARLKRLLLTQRGEESFQRINSSINRVEQQIRSAVTQEEYESLLTLLGKLKTVL